MHAGAADVDSTDWRQILGLYDLLERLAPNPMTTLNRAVAAQYREASRRAASLPERQYLAAQARRLAAVATDPVAPLSAAQPPAPVLVSRAR